jgi:hypothetical protein
MAGAGYKLFNTGDVLTAAQVNTYLNEQTVMVFASSTARTTALSGVLAEGMMSYLQDTNAVEVYNGSSWVNVGNAGDLTEIVAGTGITVTSGTGPIPTVALTTPVAATNGGTAQSTYTTGDLLYASGTNTLAKRAIGSTGDVLTVSGGVPTWAAPAGGGGKVLQVVTATTTTFTSNATTTYSDTTLTATITPTLNTSTILVLVNQNGIATEDGNASSGVGLKLLRGATDISLIATRATINFTTTGQFGTTLSTAYKDSPATTSATTYKTQFKNNVAANAAYVQIDDVMSTITLLEIGA